MSIQITPYLRGGEGLGMAIVSTQPMPAEGGTYGALVLTNIARKIVIRPGR